MVVHGDTNATVAGALAANATSIPLVHVEAGLRSFDRAMPEEHNRVVADHLADLCLAPTETNRANLAAEGIGGDKVILTGNTVVDAVLELLPRPDERAEPCCARHDLEPANYVLATFHRPENVDDPETLRGHPRPSSARLPLPVVLPLHPRTRAKIAELRPRAACSKPLRVARTDGLSRVPGPGRRVRALLVSDSGGVQEEASIIKRPVLVVRNSTERPEILGTFAQLVPPGPLIGAGSRQLLADGPSLHAPAGGDALALRRRHLGAALGGGDLHAAHPPRFVTARAGLTTPSRCHAARPKPARSRASRPVGTRSRQAAAEGPPLGPFWRLVPCRRGPGISGRLSPHDANVFVAPFAVVEGVDWPISALALRRSNGT